MSNYAYEPSGGLSHESDHYRTSLDNKTDDYGEDYSNEYKRKNNQHVVVAVRVRPLDDEGEESTICVSQNSVQLVDPTALTAVTMVEQSLHLPSGRISPTISSRQFSFDHVYSDESSNRQSDLYDDLGVKCLGRAWEGLNCSIFAYGQTGAGKSYTMMGTGGPLDASVKESDYGLIPRICCGLFNSIQKKLVMQEEKQHQNEHNGELYETADYEVAVSYVEIYNETLKDLLVNGDDRSPKNELKVREHPSKGTYVEGLSLIPCLSYKEVNGVLVFGGKQRTTSSTRANARSSRSHAIFGIIFKQLITQHDPKRKAKVSQRAVMSKINLVDLAGSERVKHTGATGTTLTEANYINKSLSALGDVIKALASRKVTKNKGNMTILPISMRYIPYRNSVLTYLLKESLGGNAVTIMIAAISAYSDHFDETLSTLKYVDQAKKMMNHATVNSKHRDSDKQTDIIVDSLRQEIAQLKKENQEVVRELLSVTNRQNAIAPSPSPLPVSTAGAATARPMPSSSNILPSTITLTNLNPDPQFSESVRHTISPGVTTIGSNQSNDIHLVGDDIEQQHCMISFEPKSNLVVIVNYGHSVTYVNGNQIPKSEMSQKESEVSGNTDDMYTHHHLSSDSLRSVVLREGFRLCFGKHHMFRLDGVGGGQKEGTETMEFAADWQFAHAELEIVKNGVIHVSPGSGAMNRTAARAFAAASAMNTGTKTKTTARLETGNENASSRTKMSLVGERSKREPKAEDQCAEFEMPDEFEEMFMSMAKSVGEKVEAVETGDYLYNGDIRDDDNRDNYIDDNNNNNNNDNDNDNDNVIESITDALANFSSQLDLMSSREKKRNYNLIDIQKSLTASQSSFLELERELAQGSLSPPHSEQSAETVILTAEGEEEKRKNALSDSFADKERQALVELRKEIFEGTAIPPLNSSEEGEISTTTITTNTRTSTEDIDLRNRARARMLARSGKGRRGVYGRGTT